MAVWRSPRDWKKGTITPIFRKGKKKDHGTSRPVRLNSMPCKEVEEILLGDMSKHPEDGKVVKDRQYGFIRGKSCLTGVKAFSKGATLSVNMGRTMDVTYLGLWKAFDTAR